MKKKLILLALLAVAVMIACPNPSALRAAFTWTPKTPMVGETVQFLDQSTGNPAHWTWAINTVSGITEKNPKGTFAGPGVFPVSLTITGADGSQKTSMQTITVVAALKASFSYSPAFIDADTTVVFTDTSVGAPTTWLWTFGDGTTAATQAASHKFAAGTWVVTLKVTNANGANTSSPQSLTVAPALVANFTWSPKNPAVGQVCQFTDTSTGGAVRWLWDFGDGTATSALQNPTHTFAAAGNYNVNLTVWNALGEMSTMSMSRMIP
jgi:PKD repeat protein